MKITSATCLIILLGSIGPQAYADPAGVAAVQAMMSSSAPLGMTFISSLGTSESTSGNRMKVAAKEDAALYVATDGAEDRPALEQAYQHYLQAPKSTGASKMDFAVGLLAQQ